MHVAPILAVLLTATAAQAQWEILTPPTTADLRGIDSVGGGVAWASGTGGAVVRTEDGGYLWQACTIPPGAERLDFRGIQAFDQNTAIVMSSGKGPLSRLYKTTDGCHTWRLLFTNPDPEGFWDAISFSGPYYGVLAGDPVRNKFFVRITEDGGHKWHGAGENTALRTSRGDSGIFAASNTNIIVAKSGFIWLVANSAGQPTFYGASIPNRNDPVDDHVWSVPTPLPLGEATSSKGVFSLACSPDHMVAVGGDYKNPSSTADTAAYADQFGVDWFAARTPPNGYRSAVAYDAATKTWMTVGPNGTDISTDDGRNWRALHPSPGLPEPVDKIPEDRNWNALSLPFVVGPHGRIGKLRSDSLKPAPKATPAPAPAPKPTRPRQILPSARPSSAETYRSRKGPRIARDVTLAGGAYQVNPPDFGGHCPHIWRSRTMRPKWYAL